MATYGSKHHMVYVRDDSDERIDSIPALRQRIRNEAARLHQTAPAQRWQTVGSGKSARRVPAAGPARDAIMRRVYVLNGRVQRLAAFYQSICEGIVE